MTIVRDHCLAPERVDAPLSGGRYRLLFEDLPPLRADEDALHALGRPGGPCDLGDDVRTDSLAVRSRPAAPARSAWPTSWCPSWDDDGDLRRGGLPAWPAKIERA
jgi:hypothetical protein